MKTILWSKDTIDWRDKNVALISQDVYMFKGSIKDNSFFKSA